MPVKGSRRISPIRRMSVRNSLLSAACQYRRSSHPVGTEPYVPHSPSSASASSSAMLLVITGASAALSAATAAMRWAALAGERSR